MVHPPCHLTPPNQRLITRTPSRSCECRAVTSAVRDGRRRPPWPGGRRCGSRYIEPFPVQYHLVDLHAAACLLPDEDHARGRRKSITRIQAAEFTADEEPEEKQGRIGSTSGEGIDEFSSGAPGYRESSRRWF